MSNQVINSGGCIANSAISAGDLLIINSGATANTILLNGGQETLFGTGSATTIEQGGILTVSGGAALDTSILSGGDATIVSAGSATSTTVSNGGTFVVLSQGSATTLAINSGGVAFIDAGGIASGISVANGGILVISATDSTTSVRDVRVDSGGYAVVVPGSGHIGTINGPVISSGVVLITPGGSIVTTNSTPPGLTIGSGATELVLQGGVASSGTVASGANQQLFAGGSANGMVLSQGFQTVSSGASATGTVIDQGAVQYVYSGGSATDTIVNAGGYALVNSHGSAIAITVNSGGIDAVDGEVSGTTVNSGGGEYVVFTGTATATTINNGGFAYVFGTASGTKISGGGYEAIQSGGTAVGVTVSNGGVLFGSSGATTASGPISGALIRNTTISSGGMELLFSGAHDTGTTIESGGTFIALPGATGDNPTSNAGAVEIKSGVVLVSGTAVTLYPTATSAGLVITSGMSDYVLFSGSESGATISNHGYSEIDSGGTAIDTTIEGGGTLAIESGGIVSGSVTFASPGGVLIIDTPSLGSAVVSDFESGDTLQFANFTGGSIHTTVSLLANNILQVTSGGTSETVQLVDPNQVYTNSSFAVKDTTSGAVVTVVPPSVASTGVTAPGSVQSTDIPLYVVPYQGGYKIGIQVSLDGGATYHMYEFDTGGTGFFAAYSPDSWSPYTVVNAAPVVMNYVSGNSYTAQIVSTNVTFQTTSGGTITADNADVGLIAAAQNLTTDGYFSTQQWNSDLTNNPSTPPLQTDFYGDFGMAMGTENGLAAILPQLPDGLSNGYIINVGTYQDGGVEQIGSIQLGLSQADISSFTTIVQMQGRNTLDTYPTSGQPTYQEALATGTLTLANGTSEPFTTDTEFIFDTGTPTMRIYEGTTITPDDIGRFLDGGNGSAVSSSTTVTTTSPAITGAASQWDLIIHAGTQSGYNEVLSSQDSTDRAGSVNTGLNAFFGYRIMFDLADGIIGFQSLSCFAAGTHILTPRGEMEISTLRPDDMVMTISGEARPIAWIGHRLVDCHRHPSPPSVQPIRIRSHAFGHGLPQRDLFLSPDHALFLEGALIPVKHLVNGSTVAQMPQSSVTYFHIELARHDVILAEGLPTETYLETGSRSAFINGGRVVQAHPDFAPTEWNASLHWEASGYAPLAVTGPALERAKRRLRECAEAALTARSDNGNPAAARA